MTSQQFLVCDNSTPANFKSWASAISAFLRSAGWTNSSDTGQLNGAGAGNWGGVTVVPGSGAFYYEIFQPGDSLQIFYLKLEYGNSSGATNSPTLRISVGATTNGAGTLTGYFTPARMISPSSFAAPSTTTTYECDFSGTSSRLSLMLWRNAPNHAPQVFAVQRSLNASGAETGTYVTLWKAGYQGGNQGGGCQQSLHFSYGPSIEFADNYTYNNNGACGWPTRQFAPGSTSSMTFNGSIPVDFLQPCVGFWDYPCTAIGVANTTDVAEGVPFSVTNQYGQTKTYLPSKMDPLYLASGWCSNYGTLRSSLAVCVEYD